MSFSLVFRFLSSRKGFAFGISVYGTNWHPSRIPPGGGKVSQSSWTHPGVCCRQAISTRWSWKKCTFRWVSHTYKISSKMKELKYKFILNDQRVFFKSQNWFGIIPFSSSMKLFFYNFLKVHSYLLFILKTL